MLQDLIIDDIKFLDQDGGEQTWSTVRKLSKEDEALGFQFRLDREEFKKRLIRQIIRKHLISQGMLPEGASVEICLARG